MDRVRIMVGSLAWEVLYLAVAIATASHTMWSLSYAFEGVEPVADGLGWELRGLLLAVAVDVGMLVVSRFLASATTRLQVASLVGAFVIAAIVSAYAQLLYIVIHTPVVTMSAGVDGGWNGWLAPLLAARVVILPLALPALATVYTVARYAHRQVPGQVKASSYEPLRGVEVSRMVEVTAQPLLDEPGATSSDLGPVLSTFYENDELEEQWEAGGYRVDMLRLTATDLATGKVYGPYKSTSSMVGALRQASRRR